MSEKIEVVYKIKNKEKNLYSAGGSWPHWDKKGKTWSSLTYVYRHLKILNKEYDGNCVIEHIEIKSRPISETPVNHFIQKQQEEELKKSKEKQRSKEEWEKKKRYEDYLKLKKEFE